MKIVSILAINLIQNRTSRNTCSIYFVDWREIMLKLLLLFIVSTKFSLAQLVVPTTSLIDYEYGYYTYDGLKKKILKLSESEFLFYGNEGSILKTTDAGITWDQKFNGTYANFIQMVYYHGVIYAITDFKEILFSNDKGNYWKIKKLDFDITSICVINDAIFLSTKTDTLLISYDKGDNFFSLKTNFNGIDYLTSNDNNLIIGTKDNKFYYTEYLALSWYKIETAFPSDWKLVKKNNSIFLIDSSSIAKLNDDFTIETYSIFDKKTRFDFCSFDSYLKIIKYPIPAYDEVEFIIYQLNLKSTSLNIIGTIDYHSFDVKSYHILEYQIVDVESIGNDLLFLANANRIIKYEQSTNSTIVLNDITHIYNQPNQTIFIDFDNWYKLFTYKSGLGFTNNSGLKYDFSNHISAIDYHSNLDKYFDIDLFANETSYSTSHIINKNNMLFFSDYLFNPELKKYFKVNTSGTGNWSKTTDGGLSWEVINSKELGIRKSIEHFKESLIYISGHINKNYILTQNYKDTTSFYLLKEDNSVELISTLDKSERVEIILDEKNDLVWCINTLTKPIEIDNETINKKHIQILYSDDSLKTWDLVFETDNFVQVEIASLADDSPVIIYNYIDQSSDSSLVKLLIVNTTVNEFTELNILNNNYDNIDFSYNSEHYSKINKYNRIINLEKDKFFGKYSYIENNKLVRVVDMINFKHFDNKIEINKHFENVNFGFHSVRRIPIIFLENDESNLYFKTSYDRAGFNIYRPIEPERLEYYSSVQKTETRNYLWTYPPYPHPTNGIIKVETYWDSALPFTEKDIEIYDLTGVKINTENTLSVQKESNCNGKIIWDASNYKTGIYIMKITHGTETRVRKIMVVE